MYQASVHNWSPSVGNLYPLPSPPSLRSVVLEPRKWLLSCNSSLSHDYGLSKSLGRFSERLSHLLFMLRDAMGWTERCSPFDLVIQFVTQYLHVFFTQNIGS